MKKVMIVHDDEEIRNSLKRALERLPGEGEYELTEKTRECFCDKYLKEEILLQSPENLVVILDVVNQDGEIDVSPAWRCRVRNYKIILLTPDNPDKSDRQLIPPCYSLYFLYYFDDKLLEKIRKAITEKDNPIFWPNSLAFKYHSIAKGNLDRKKIINLFDEKTSNYENKFVIGERSLADFYDEVLRQAVDNLLQKTHPDSRGGDKEEAELYFKHMEYIGWYFLVQNNVKIFIIDNKSLIKDSGRISLKEVFDKNIGVKTTVVRFCAPKKVKYYKDVEVSGSSVTYCEENIGKQGNFYLLDFDSWKNKADVPHNRKETNWDNRKENSWEDKVRESFQQFWNAEKNCFKFDAIILDIFLKDVIKSEINYDGIDILRALKQKDKRDTDFYYQEINDVPIIMLSRFGDEEHIIRAIRGGADWYIPKEGVTEPDLETSLRQIPMRVYEMYSMKMKLQREFCRLAEFVHRIQQNKSNDDEIRELNQRDQDEAAVNVPKNIMSAENYGELKNHFDNLFEDIKVPHFVRPLYDSLKKMLEAVGAMLNAFEDGHWVNVKREAEEILREEIRSLHNVKLHETYRLEYQPGGEICKWLKDKNPTSLKECLDEELKEIIRYANRKIDSWKIAPPKEIF